MRSTIAPVLVDTNVLVYVRDASEAEKQPAAGEWLTALWDTGRGRVSFQVLHEYYVTVTAKLDPGMPPEDARDDVEALRAWDPFPVGYPTLETAWDIQDRHGFSFWDSLVVAAAVRGGCRWLLTEDLSDGQEVDGVTIVNPFAHSPQGILAPGNPRSLILPASAPPFRAG